MAYLLHVHVTDAGGVGLVPDSLAETAWATGFRNAHDAHLVLSSDANPCFVLWMENETELDEYFGATKVPAEHTATVDAWKTANSISVTYALYDLSGSALDISGKAKY